MAGFTGIKDIVDAELEGRVRNYQWRKTPSQVTTAGIWFDLANASGMPPAKQWFDAAPLTATQIKQSTDKGIYHGPNVSTSQKYLRKTINWSSSATPLPMTMQLCDYLLYYPTVDDSETGLQEMDNTNTLPRYTDGVGVQMMAITTGARTGGQTFNVTYTNSDGVAGRVSKTMTQNTSSILGTVTTTVLTPTNNTSGGPFIGLQDGDSGVRSIESVQMNGIDSGFMTLILVKPLAETFIRENSAPVEIDHLIHHNQLPRIYDDAFLGYLCLPNGSLASVVLSGTLKIVWN
jgi:hypothetical protein